MNIAAGRPAPRVLVAIPAFNEAPTIASVVERVRAEAPELDLLVIDDGSSDPTGAVLRRSGVATATHLANLGYGRALQTAITYAERTGYDALITFDADGQHRASDLRPLLAAFTEGGYDLLIGSRFDARRGYAAEPLVRRLGMRLFSTLIALFTGRRIYDTSSGLKVIGRRVFPVLRARPFVDFHAEALVYLIESGYTVGESPIAVEPRRHGESMYSPLSALKYPMKVSFLILIGALEGRLGRRRAQTPARSGRIERVEEQMRHGG
ncbi:MAG: glycosyltransferase family 2 protein [Acidobacteria bacterium]|nr:glycosyltransferase family 2 protein [Acidobacteriota bacterium]